MIELHEVRKTYGTREVLRGVSFTVKPGEMVAYLGPNGAGKSTTVKIIAGLLRAGDGQVKVCGHDVASNPIEAKKHLGYVPDDVRLYETLTPAEYLSLVAELHHLDRTVARDRITQMFAAFELTSVANRALETLSRGQRQKVLLISALVHDPEVLLLDEPLNGLDVNSGMAFRQILESLLQRGKAILFCSHIFELAERLCKRTVIIDQGTIVLDALTSDILARSKTGTLQEVFGRLTRADQAGEGAKAFLEAFKPSPTR